MKNRKRIPPKTIFICNSIINNKLISLVIESNSLEQAEIIFEKEFSAKSEVTHGPFFKRKVKKIKNVNQTDIQFSGKSERAIYNNWFVSALFLNHPKDSAMLLFDKRTDDKVMSKPSGTFIVQIKDLRILNK